MRGVTMALLVVLVGARIGTAGRYDAPTGIERAAAGAPCGGGLGNNVYRCTVRPEAGDPFDDCFRFVSPGDVSDHFDLLPDQLGIVLGCTCKVGGSAKRPRFDSSPAFECTGEDYTFEGVVKAKGKKIKTGFISTAAGASFVFACAVDAACTVAP